MTDCGCRIDWAWMHYPGSRIIHCPLHAAAGQMQELVEHIREVGCYDANEYPPCEICDRIFAALAAAKPEGE